MRKKRIRFAGLVLTAFALAAVMTAAACAEAEPQKQNDDGRGYAAAGVEEQADETKNKNADMEEAAKNAELKIAVGGTVLTASLEENSSAQALEQLLADGPLTIEMRDYGNMEKVGALGAELPENNEELTAQAGDLILYQGDSFVIYYAQNTWNLTRLGKIRHTTADELKEILGNGDVTVTLSLNKE